MLGMRGDPEMTPSLSVIFDRGLLLRLESKDDREGSSDTIVGGLGEPIDMPGTGGGR